MRPVSLELIPAAGLNPRHRAPYYTKAAYRVLVVATPSSAPSAPSSASREQRRVIYYTHNSPSQLSDVRASRRPTNIVDIGLLLARVQSTRFLPLRAEERPLVPKVGFEPTLCWF